MENGSPWEWETSVVVVRSAVGELLLVRQAYGHHFYALPGGKVEAGESARSAAERELWEEAGVTALELSYGRAYDLTYPGTGARYRAHVFHAVVSGDAPQTRTPDEISWVGWRALDDLPQPLTPSAAAVSVDLRAGLSLPLAISLRAPEPCAWLIG